MYGDLYSSQAQLKVESALPSAQAAGRAVGPRIKSATTVVG